MREVVFSLLLASNRRAEGEVCALPRELWLNIFRRMDRDWVCEPSSVHPPGAPSPATMAAVSPDMARSILTWHAIRGEGTARAPSTASTQATSSASASASASGLSGSGDFDQATASLVRHRLSEVKGELDFLSRSMDLIQSVTANDSVGEMVTAGPMRDFASRKATLEHELDQLRDRLEACRFVDVD
jgi:hypothetical protein